MNRTILIADDEAHLRLLMEQILEPLTDEGVRLVVCEDGLEAREMIRRHQPCLAFLDVMMPRMNGFDVCVAVRADPTLSAMRVVIVSAKGEFDDTIRGTKVGADRYVHKPFDPAEILEIAEEALERA